MPTFHPPKKSPYDQDTLGKMFARNAKLIRIMIVARLFLDKIPDAGLNDGERTTLQEIKNEIDYYNKISR